VISINYFPEIVRIGLPSAVTLFAPPFRVSPLFVVIPGIAVYAAKALGAVGVLTAPMSTSGDGSE
jgi:hypothetical protein